MVCKLEDSKANVEMADYKPKISVIIPCYNQAKYLPEAILSIKRQTYQNWECIVINDGSIDNTSEVAAKSGITDNRIHYLEQSNQGLSFARNKGLDYITGKYIQFLDADDNILPGKFENQLIMLKKAKGLALAYCDYRRGSMDNIDIEPNPQAPYLPPKYDDSPLYMQLAQHWETRMSIPTHCFLFDSRIFSEFQIRFDTKLLNHEDWDCWMRIASLPVEAMFHNEVLAIYRCNNASMSQRPKDMLSGFLHAIDKQININRDNPEMLKILREKRLETIRDYSYYGWYRQLIENPGRFLKRKVKKVLPAKMKSFIRSMSR